MRIIDCVGDICPVPVIKLKKALAEGIEGGIKVIVDNEIAVQNISKLLNAQKHVFSTAEDNAQFSILVNASDIISGDIIKEETHALSDITNSDITNTELVIISSETMGMGDDALGKILAKGFIFAITQLDTLPGIIIFYNGGVRHALQTSESFGDLQKLQEQGVKILVCGTCLNHYGIKADVGEATNMYEIVTLMQSASKIIRP